MIIAQSYLPMLRKEHADKQIVYTSGSFDILHVGHLDLLKWAKSQGDVLVVALNSDIIISQKKGPSRPVVTLEDRKNILDGLKPVDYVLAVEGDDASSMPWLATGELLQPDVCVLGPDWADSELAKWQAIYPYANVLVSPPRLGPSTTALIDKITMATRT